MLMDGGGSQQMSDVRGSRKAAKEAQGEPPRSLRWGFDGIYGLLGGFLKWGYPQIILDHFCIETHGFGDPPFTKHPFPH